MDRLRSSFDLENQQDEYGEVNNHRKSRIPEEGGLIIDDTLISKMLLQIYEKIEQIVLFAFPISISHALIHAASVLNIFFLYVRFHNMDHILAVGFSTMLINVLGYYILLCFAQSFKEEGEMLFNKGKLNDLGLYYNIALTINISISLLLILFIYFMTPKILDVVFPNTPGLSEHNADLQRYALQYVYSLFSSLIFYAFYQTCQVFSNCVGNYDIPMIIPAIGVLSHFAISYYLAQTDNFTVSNLALSKCVSDFICCTLFYFWQKGRQQEGKIWTQYRLPHLREALSQFFNVVFSALHKLMETFPYDVITIAAFYFQNESEIQGHLIIYTIAFLNYHFAEGFSESVNFNKYQLKNYLIFCFLKVFQTLTQTIENGLPNRTTNFLHISIILILAVSLGEFFLIISVQQVIMTFFVDYSGTNFILLADIYQYLLFFDNILVVGNGILNSLREFKRKIQYHMLFFYCVGIPVGIFCIQTGIVGDQVAGIWIGYLIANVCYVITLIYFLFIDLDIKKQVKTIKDQMDMEMEI